MANFISRIFGFGKTEPLKKRKFDAAKPNRMLTGWATGSSGSFRKEISSDLNSLRARSRDLSLNNPYARRFFDILAINVVGTNGISLEMQVKEYDTAKKIEKLDTWANGKIKKSFSQWAKKSTPSNDTWTSVQAITVETLARDGEVFIHQLKGKKYGEFEYQLRFIEADLVETGFNFNLDNGNVIRDSIEFDVDGVVTAYHIWRFNKDDCPSTTNQRLRIPAEEIIHIFYKERPNQHRGYPWLAPSILTLKAIDSYQESELVAARVASAKMGILTRPKGEDLNSDLEVDEDNSYVQSVEPGSFEVLPEGWHMDMFDPKHPNTGFSEFVGVLLKSVAASMGVSYHTLTGDFNGSNGGAIRQALLEEREFFRVFQHLLIDQLCNVVFDNWLKSALLTQALNLPFEKLDKFNAAEWRPRTFPALDPAKDAMAIKSELELKLRSRSDVINEMGRSFEDVMQEIAKEDELMKQLGISITAETTSAQDAEQILLGTQQDDSATQAKKGKES